MGGTLETPLYLSASRAYSPMTKGRDNNRTSASHPDLRRPSSPSRLRWRLSTLSRPLSPTRAAKAVASSSEVPMQMLPPSPSSTLILVSPQSCPSLISTSTSRTTSASRPPPAWFPPGPRQLTWLPLTGRTRFDRLLFIGKTCLPLCVEALKAAILEAKQGPDVARYKDAWDCIRQAAPQEPEATRDDAWIERNEAANRAETSRLEAELKGYKNNLIKESIRVTLSSSLIPPCRHLAD